MDSYTDGETGDAPDPARPDEPVDGIPRTGDPEVDEVVAELARARHRPLADHITAGERAHRVLQARLGDLGGE